MKVHMKRRHGMTRECSLCKLMFGTRKGLEKHTMGKRGVRITENQGFNVYNFKCSDCWQTFRSSKARDKHDKKEHKCGDCKDKFTNCQEIKDHQSSQDSKQKGQEVHNCTEQAKDSADMNCWKCGQFLPMTNQSDFKRSRGHIAHHRQQLNPGQGMTLMYRKLSIQGQDLKCPYDECNFKSRGLFGLNGHLIYVHHLFSLVLRI